MRHHPALRSRWCAHALVRAALIAAFALPAIGCVNHAAINAFKQSSDRLIGGVGDAASHAARYDGYADAVFVPADGEPSIATATASYQSGVSTAVRAQGKEAAFSASIVGAQMVDVRNNLVRKLKAELAPEWQPKCMGQLEALLAKGWILCKVGHSSGNINFGSFVVPVAIFTWGSIPGSTTFYVHLGRKDFQIMGPGAVPQGAPAPVARPDRDTDGGSTEQKLMTLKRLHDAGAITDQEYEARRAKLLQQLE